MLSLIDVVRARGPLTVAAYMDLALYDAQFGYYARAARRSGRAGDFFTSVDVGPLFGELLAVQVAEMADHVTAGGAGAFDLVEAGASDGRLAGDIIRALRRHAPALAARTRVHLVETSPAARAAQRLTLADVIENLASQASTTADLPQAVNGVIVANELLDALPVHQVVARGGTLREIYVVATGDGLDTIEGPPSTPDLADYFGRLGLTLEDGCRAEVGLRARDWIADAVQRLGRGFLILIDYGHPAVELYSWSHAGGTLTTFSRHAMTGPESGAVTPAWLRRPGEQDITAHVDFTTVQTSAAAAGATTVGLLDQTYFVLGLLDGIDLTDGRPPAEQWKRRLALKTLLMPGGLGSTLKVLILEKGLTDALRGLAANRGRATLKGCSYRVRAT